MKLNDRVTRRRLVILLGVVASLVLGVWLVRTSTTPSGKTEIRGAAPLASAEDPRLGPAPRFGHRIAEQGRLTLEGDELPTGASLELTLEMPDEVRGSKALPVVIASVDGRRLETVAAIAPGSGAGIQLEIDSLWLKSGTYMISVETAEAGHFPLRRYVLVVH